MPHCGVSCFNYWPLKKGLLCGILNGELHVLGKERLIKSYVLLHDDAIKLDRISMFELYGNTYEGNVLQ